MPFGQSLRQARGQIGSVNLLLRCLDIVWNPVEGNGRFVAVKQCKCRSGIAVAWLSDRARINQIVGAGKQLHLKVLRLPIAVVGGTNGNPLLVISGETALNMSVSKECNGHLCL